MEDFRLTAMRDTARTIERWQTFWGKSFARELVVEVLSGVHSDVGPDFRAAYLTAFGR